jgi:small subunit ribosomal protein S21
MPEVIVRKGEPIDRALKRSSRSSMRKGSLMSSQAAAFETPTRRRAAKNNAKRSKMKIRFNLNLP